MLTVPLNITLHSNQQLIHDSGALIIVVKAGKRFGKSELAIYKTIKWAFAKPGGMFWFVAPTYGQAESIAWNRFLEILPTYLIKRKVDNKLMIVLVNGSTIRLLGSDNETSLRGPHIDGVVLDEAAYMRKYIWNNILRGQLLGRNGEAPGKAFFISSPINPLQTIGKNIKDWYTEFYNEALRKQMAGNKDWAAFEYTIYDNPTLTKEYIDDMRNDSTDEEWNIEYMAKESAHTGTVYTEFNYRQHVMECKNEGVLVRGHDWGIDHPTVCLWAYVSKDKKQIYIEDEFVNADFTIEENVGVIKKKTGERPVSWDICDPSLNKRNGQTKRTDKDEYARLGIFCSAGDNGNRGYKILKMMFKKDMIRVNPKCRNLINQLRNLQWTDKVGDDTCFIAGTKISCLDGYKNIETVRPGDMVLTRKGYRRVLASSITNDQANVYELKTSNGILVATGNHPFFMNDGSIKRLDELRDGEFLFDSRYLNLMQYAIWKLKSYLAPVSNSMGSASTVWVVGISRDALEMAEKLCCSIVKSGSIITEKFQKIITFITEITTRQTIRFPIWNYCLAAGIENITPAHQKRNQYAEKSLKNLLVLRLLSGTKVVKVESFTNGSLEKCGKQKSGIQRIAQFVAESIKPLSLRALNFAIQIVGNVTRKGVKVLSVVPLPTKQPVFNLTIEANSEYIANGLLVHNCDTLRYIAVRVHDLMFGGKLLEGDGERAVAHEHRVGGPISLHDPDLFPQKVKAMNNAWIMEEIVG